MGPNGDEESRARYASHGTTRAKAGDVTDQVWSVAHIVAIIRAFAPAPKNGTTYRELNHVSNERAVGF